MPLIIGIAGSIATGKSTACETMINLGVEHCDADKVVHRMYDPGKPAFGRIIEIFGPEVVGSDGYIDRKVLGSKVFGKPEEMSKLTRAIGDIAAAVKAVIDEWRSTLGRTGVAVIEAVNLIEAGYGQWCDQIWLFACEEDTARQRLMDRNRFTAEEANQRLASQRPWSERAPASDRVVHNDGTPAEFSDAVRAALAEVRDECGSGALRPSRYHAWWGEHVRIQSEGAD
jgi:dephospho-CoA kinase